MYAGVVFWVQQDPGTKELRKGAPFHGLIAGSCLRLTQKWTVLRDTHADKAREFHGKGCHAYDKGTPGELLCRLMFYGKALAPGLSLASHLACTRICWFRIHLSGVGTSAKMESSVKDSGRLVGSIGSSLLLAPPQIFSVSFTRHIMGWHLLVCLLPFFLAPPESWIHSPHQLVFSGSTFFFFFLIRTSCCETTPASGYQPTWPRWAVSGQQFPNKGVRMILLWLFKNLLVHLCAKPPWQV